MTIALAIKVNDGLVLAADSATTMTQMTQNGQQQIINIYNNANKVFNLHKLLPVGIITWGLGNIGASSISTLFKDFRHEITNGANKIDINNYAIIDIVNRFRDFIKPRHKQAGHNQGLGFLIAGYSTGKDYPEEWIMEFNDKGDFVGPNILRGENDTCMNWYGQPEAIRRLVVGIPGGIEFILQTVGGPIEIVAITKHEGYKWIKRKLYFKDGLNPREVRL